MKLDDRDDTLRTLALADPAARLDDVTVESARGRSIRNRIARLDGASTSRRTSLPRRVTVQLALASVLAIAIVTVSAVSDGLGRAPAAVADLRNAASTTAASAERSLRWRSTTDEYAASVDVDALEEPPTWCNVPLLGSAESCEVVYDGYEHTQSTSEWTVAGDDFARVLPVDDLTSIDDPAFHDHTAAVDYADEIRRVDGQVYLHFASGYAGRTGWVRWDGSGADQLVPAWRAQAGPIDLRQILDVRDAEQVDTTMVNGERMRTYRLPGGMEDLVDPRPLFQLAAWHDFPIETMSPSTGEFAAPNTTVEVWVDDDNLIRRIDARSAEALVEGEPPAGVTIEMFDIGAAVVQAPGDATAIPGLVLQLPTVGPPEDGAPEELSLTWTTRPEAAPSSAAAITQRDGDDWAHVLPTSGDAAPKRRDGRPATWAEEWRIVDGRVFLRLPDDAPQYQGWVEYTGGDYRNDIEPRVRQWRRPTPASGTTTAPDGTARTVQYRDIGSTSVEAPQDAEQVGTELFTSATTSDQPEDDPSEWLLKD